MSTLIDALWAAGMVGREMSLSVPISWSVFYHWSYHSLAVRQKHISARRVCLCPSAGGEREDIFYERKAFFYASRCLACLMTVIILIYEGKLGHVQFTAPCERCAYLMIL